MYEVRNEHNDTVYKNQNERLVRMHAEYLHSQNPKLHYAIFRVDQIWTTQKLTEGYVSSFEYELSKKLK